jgi:hypothetical protein
MAIIMPRVVSSFAGWIMGSTSWFTRRLGAYGGELRLQLETAVPNGDE